MSKDLSDQLAPVLNRMLTTLEEKVNPSHTALVVVDVQNDFCACGGFLDKEDLDVSLIQAMVPRLTNFIDKAREVGLPIIYIQTIYVSKNNWYLSDVWLEQQRRVGKGRYKEYPVLEKDSWGVEFYSGIKPLPEEAVVQKHRYGAFVETDLDIILRSKGIRTLIMSGVATNCCVESTAREGFMKDYYVVFLKDCTAATTEELHNSTLRNIDLYFGEVVDSSDVIRCWKRR